MKKMNKKGFTIVELVIVIAVIGILAAVLIPTFSSITASARESAALQEATSGRNAILALTGGSLPEGSLFIVGDEGTGEPEYAFAYEGNSMAAKSLEDSTTMPYPYSTGTTTVYAVYVAEDAITVSEADATQATLSAGVSKMVANAYNLAAATDITLPEGVVNIESEDSSDYYKVDLGQGTGVEIRIYYTSDIAESLIAFIGSSTDADDPAASETSAPDVTTPAP